MQIMPIHWLQNLILSRFLAVNDRLTSHKFPALVRSKSAVHVIVVVDLAAALRRAGRLSLDLKSQS